jgi:hypothetical protein
VLTELRGTAVKKGGVLCWPVRQLYCLPVQQLPQACGRGWVLSSTGVGVYRSCWCADCFGQTQCCLPLDSTWGPVRVQHAVVAGTVQELSGGVCRNAILPQCAGVCADACSVGSRPFCPACVCWEALACPTHTCRQAGSCMHASCGVRVGCLLLLLAATELCNWTPQQHGVRAACGCCVPCAPAPSMWCCLVQSCGVSTPFANSIGSTAVVLWQLEGGLRWRIGSWTQGVLSLLLTTFRAGGEQSSLPQEPCVFFPSCLNLQSVFPGRQEICCSVTRVCSS